MKQSIRYLPLLGCLLAALSCTKTQKPTVPKSLPAATLLQKVPAGALGVVVIQSPTSLWHTITTQMPLPMNKEGIQSLHNELDPFLRKEIGINPMKATTAVGFAVGTPETAAFLIGRVDGQLQGERVVFSDDDVTIVAVQHEDILVIGTKTGVDKALTTLKGHGKTLQQSNPVFYDKIKTQSHSGAVPLVIAVDAVALGELFPVPQQLKGISSAFLAASFQKLSLAVSGEAEAIKNIQGMLVGGLALARMQLPSAIQDEANDDTTLENQIGLIYGKFLALNLLNQIKPDVHGDMLSLSLSFATPDPVEPHPNTLVAQDLLKYGFKDALGAAFVQSEFALHEWILGKTWLTASERRSVESEVAELLRTRLGMIVSALHGGVLFVETDASGNRLQYVAVIPGVDGVPTPRVLESHSTGTAADIVAVSTNGTLLLGTRTTVQKAQQSLNGIPSSNPEFYQRLSALAGHTAVSLIDLSRAPTQAMPQMKGLTFVRVSFNDGQFEVVLEGPQQKLSDLRDIYSGALTAAQTEVTEAKNRAVSEGPWIAGAGLIIGDHLFQGALEHLQLDLQGNKLSLTLAPSVLRLD